MPTWDRRRRAHAGGCEVSPHSVWRDEASCPDRTLARGALVRRVRCGESGPASGVAARLLETKPSRPIGLLEESHEIGTFSRREDRCRARRLAAELGVRVFFVETHCSGEVALRRLARRSAEDGNPSDAGSERYLASASAFEKLEEWPVESRVRVRTDRGGWRETLRGIMEKLRG